MRAGRPTKNLDQYEITQVEGLTAYTSKLFERIRGCSVTIAIKDHQGTRLLFTKADVAKGNRV